MEEGDAVVYQKDDDAEDGQGTNHRKSCILDHPKLLLEVYEILAFESEAHAAML